MQEQRSNISSLSFARVYHEHFDFVRAMTRQLGVQPEAIEDVVQEVFLVVHRKLHTLTGSDVLRDWLYGIVRRKVSTHRRKVLRVRTEMPLPLHWLTASGSTAPDVVERSVEARQALALIGEIDPKKRDVLLMAKVEELSCVQIAQALSIPVSTAYARLRNGKAALAAAIGLERTGELAAHASDYDLGVAQILRDGRLALKPSVYDKLRLRLVLAERIRSCA